MLDDVHHPAGDGETVIEGDSVILAFDPTNRSPDAASQSSAYYVSSQKPAGAAACTRCGGRSQHSGGRPAGHLARDSSVHEIAVKAEGGGASTSCAFRGASWGSRLLSGRSSASPSS